MRRDVRDFIIDILITITVTLAAMIFVAITFTSCKAHYSTATDQHIEGYNHKEGGKTLSAFRCDSTIFSFLGSDDVTKIVNRHIRIYDVSNAVDTGGGFYAPVIADIYERDTTTQHTTKEVAAENVSSKVEESREEQSEDSVVTFDKEKTVCTGASLADYNHIFIMCGFLLCVILLYHKFKRGKS